VYADVGTRRGMEGTCAIAAEEVEPVLPRAARRFASVFSSVSGVEPPVCALTHSMATLWRSLTLLAELDSCQNPIDLRRSGTSGQSSGRVGEREPLTRLTLLPWTTSNP